MMSGIVTATCKIKSGGVMSPAITSNMKYAYFLVRFKKLGVRKPMLVKNIKMIGSSSTNANASIVWNKKRKYLSTVNISLNISSFKSIKNGKRKFVNTIYPTTKPMTNKRKMAGIYDKVAFFSLAVSPGLIKSHN